MKIAHWASLAVFAATLTGCGAVQDLGSLVGADSGQKEVVAIKNPPLAVPPDYGLRPPQGGSSRIGAVQAQRRARQTVTGVGGNTVVLKDRTAGESALLRLAGYRAGIDSRIRSEIDREGVNFGKEEEQFVDKLLKWKKDGGPEGKPEDGGVLPTLGGDTRPVIKRRGEF